MAEKDPQEITHDRSETLTDDQIVTERKLSRRSFLTTTGAVLAGAVVVGTALRAMAQEQATDPDQKKKKKTTKAKASTMKKAADPDKKKSKKSSKAKEAPKASDPDHNRR